MPYVYKLELPTAANFFAAVEAPIHKRPPTLINFLQITPAGRAPWGVEASSLRIDSPQRWGGEKERQKPFQ